MALPIIPRFMADTVVLQTLSISFHPVWDGANWVLTPADITLKGGGHLSENGIQVTTAGIDLTALDLPPAGQAAVQDLYNFIEQEMATLYG